MRVDNVILIIVLIFNSSCSVKEKAEPVHRERSTIQNMGVQSHGPAVVELTGKLIVKRFYGPPNFGENPETDAKEDALILLLNKPINAKDYSPDMGNETSVESVSELQLVLSTPYQKLIGKTVTVSGTLFYAHTGHHHTDLLMDVRSINLVGTN